ncbi:MAG TPA: 4Fe-4S binding protein [Candidatus Azoamicus sp.]
MNLTIKKISKSSSLILGLLVILLSFFSSTCLGQYLSLKNNNLNCLENDCKLKLKNNESLKKNNIDERIINLIEENNGKEKLINYLFYTTDINDIGAYSGKPLEILISLKNNGIIIDNLKLIKHSEPILLTGIPIEKLLEAICFYKNKNISKKINIGDDLTNDISIPIIAGATVTSLILHETILDTSREVSKLLGKISDDDLLPGGLTNKFKKYTWDELNKIGAIKNYKLNSEFNDNINNSTDSLLIDMYFADLKHPSIGKNLLGEKEYENLFKDLKNNESAIIILNKGEWSFKGSGFVRGGIFDRFRIEQGNNVFTFRDLNFKNVYDLDLIDVEDFRETGIFIINNSKYKAWKNWNLVLLHNYKTYYSKYEIPKKFCIKQESKITKIWLSKKLPISMFLLIWILTILIFIKRDSLSKNNFYLSVIYNFVLVLDIYIIGIIFESQPSVVNIFALIDNPKSFETFMLDPCIFLGWIMILATIFIWGKALFCGWICPFGALQELSFKIRSIIIKNDTSIEFSNKITDKLKFLRYIIFISLVLISLKNMHLAEEFAEIEPFKTTWIIGITNRPPLVALYTISLLLIGLLTYRFFCRFVCPLGAFLSILSIFTFFKINRRGTCSACKICKKSCNSRAITNLGNIDSKECFGCFTCINNMHNAELCPPFKNIKIREKYEKNWREV